MNRELIALRQVDPDLPRQHRAARPFVLRSPEAHDVLVANLELVERQSESPIERQFGMALAIELFHGGTRLRIEPQRCLENFRYDFAIVYPKLDQVLAFVECDGKEFHSTPPQLANDRRKDLAANEADAIIVRFTGSAIYRDPRDCAVTVLFRIRHAWRIP